MDDGAADGAALAAAAVADAAADGARGVFAGFSPDVNTAVVAPDTVCAAVAVAVAACFS